MGCCEGMQRLADFPYLGGFLFSGLPRVARYCVPGGVRVVSKLSSHPRKAVMTDDLHKAHMEPSELAIRSWHDGENLRSALDKRRFTMRTAPRTPLLPSSFARSSR
jgi:hypothetical protein